MTSVKVWDNTFDFEHSNELVPTRHKCFSSELQDPYVLSFLLSKLEHIGYETGMPQASSNRSGLTVSLQHDVNGHHKIKINWDKC